MTTTLCKDKSFSEEWLLIVDYFNRSQLRKWKQLLIEKGLYGKVYTNLKCLELDLKI